MNRFLNFFENLTIKNKIIFLIIASVIIIILTRILVLNKNYNSYTSSIDYKNISISELLNNYQENYNNRDIYVQLKDIISQMKSYYNGSSDAYEIYYSVLDSRYSSKISKGNFSEKMNSIFEKINNNENDFTIKVYKENNNSNIYIAEICADETVGYIGFILDFMTYTYSIFYIE